MEHAWAGTSRFEVRQRLGAGASGDVYEVLDRKLGAIVALKALSRTDPTNLYLFKQEFRELADMHHRHLVTLYELEEDAGHWFFTMELVRGKDFLSHIRPRAASPPAMTGQQRIEASETPTVTLAPGRSREAPSFKPWPSAAEPLNGDGLARLRDCASQLATGVEALHRARKLHRDLKPSNVRVETGGRVVLLDFGLVLPLHPSGAGTTGHIAGTPTYMSPEQAMGLRISEASDWYAVGVMLFQALTGTTPFPGLDMEGLLAVKCSVDAPAPSHVVPEVPPDLDALCIALLRRDPEQRPSGPAVLDRLGARPVPEVDTSHSPDSDEAPAFVGRRPELSRLEAAYEATRKGRPAVVWVRGPSGIGKSRLCRVFIDELLERDPGTVVLSGRCYQQESVPFEGLDSVVDALCRFLGGLPEDEAGAYLPPDAAELGRVFPVLRQVPGIGGDRPAATTANPIELRRRAFGALRDLLGRIAARAPLVLTIDDLQWGGDDSGALLAELLQPPEPPAMLVLGTVRSDEAEASPMLHRLAPELDRLAGGLVRDEITLDVLAPSEARALAASVGGGGANAFVSRIAAESEGNPFFVCALARENERATVSLEGVIGASIDRLAPAAQRVLSVVAVSGRPTDKALALRVADIGDEGAGALAELRSRHMIRLLGDDRVEAYHDRIRDGMLARLGEDATAAAHLRIADALEVAGGADPEHVARHLVSAGARRRAAPHAVEAARRAGEALAFERASDLYRLALSLDDWDPQARADLSFRLSETLANAGRGTNAGQAYLQTAELVHGERAIELRRRAAEQLLMSGRIEQGTELLRSVLASVGVGYPRTQLGTMAAIVWYNLQLRLRGLAYRERREADVAPEVLRRIDACWAVCHGLAGASPLTSMAFVARGALLALRAGEPSRIANFLTLHATLMESLAPGTMHEELEVARDAAVRADNDYSSAFNATARAAGLYFAGDVRGYVSAFETVEQLLRERCRGVAWEISTFQSLANFARTFLGDWRLAAQTVHLQVREAEQRGDLYGAATLAMSLGWVRHLAVDDPRAALRELDEYLARWGSREMHYQHFYDCEARAYVLLYMGDARGALEYVDHRWPELERGGLLRVQIVHTLMLATRITSLISASYEPGVDCSALLRRARRDIRTMRTLSFRPADAWGLHLLGCVAVADGDRDGGLSMLEAAGTRMREDGYRTGPISGDLLRGEIIGGAEGAALEAPALEYFGGQGFREPRRFAHIFAPARVTRAPATS